MGNTILIIEDNFEMSENISELLNLAGYKVVIAENGRLGLEAAKKTHPDLILCDVMMPELDGYGVLRALGNLPDLRGIPFVFITAQTEKNNFRKGMDLGADDYLVKPFEGDDLLRVVETRIRKGAFMKGSFENTLNGLDKFMQHVNTVLNTEIFTEHKLEKKVRKKDTIFMEGDSAGHIYFVSKGKIKTCRTNDFGKEYITGIYKDGDFFGYLALFDNRKRRDSAVAMENSEIIVISCDYFQKLLFSNSEVAYHFIKFMLNNQEETEQRLLQLAYDSVRKRVAEALLYIFRKYNAKENEWIPVNRENVSMLAGISPESASRSLTDFREEGLIETGNGCMKICNLIKLQNLKY